MLTNIKGIIFDYGGTIDTNSRHWAKVLWSLYQKYNIPIDEDSFREAYIFGERSLARYPYVSPNDDFYQVLIYKTKLQVEYLASQNRLPMDETLLWQYAKQVAESSYQYVLDVLKITRPVVEELSRRYKLVLVSNFYGNIQTILNDFELNTFFSSVVESSIVGVRKPDPAIYHLGVNAMGFSANEVVVVGDSFSKDIVSAKKVGCKAIWLKGEGWGKEEVDESLPDAIITSLVQLLKFV
ncbi:MAG: HAD family hydrolase [Phocaeicola sp.]|uniref:HAD family hydrolase n=1 Tax=Phocaeicola sp. TaxID=2773926 RepID=UPI003FA12E73